MKFMQDQGLRFIVRFNVWANISFRFSMRVKVLLGLDLPLCFFTLRVRSQVTFTVMISVRETVNFMYRFWVRLCCSVRYKATTYDDIGVGIVFKAGVCVKLSLVRL